MAKRDTKTDTSFSLKDSLDSSLLEQLRKKRKELKNEEEQKKKREERKRVEERKRREKNKSFEELLNESNLDWRKFK